MKELSVFDIIGPNMIGPSSSHTAGALRIALLAQKMMRGRIVRADFTLYGSFARTYRGHGTDKALAAGILGFGTEDYRIREAFHYAEAQGVACHFHADTDTEVAHPNTVAIDLTDEAGETMRVVGESIGGGAAVIREINGVEIALSGEYNTILIKQMDKPGVLAHITKCLSDYDINIAFTKLYREKKGELAYTIIETDEDIEGAVLRAIAAAPNILSAVRIEM
ncbi:MAG: L-serine ammonia-lyase, iron-sulfur-dependent subunit beta [Eubacterium sp.]|nr:L-serine ammonia-lyase, iron-sulfur-dependent subunit beta [Eubacterium sp.]